MNEMLQYLQETYVRRGCCHLHLRGHSMPWWYHLLPTLPGAHLHTSKPFFTKSFYEHNASIHPIRNSEKQWPNWFVLCVYPCFKLIHWFNTLLHWINELDEVQKWTLKEGNYRWLCRMNQCRNVLPRETRMWYNSAPIMVPSPFLSYSFKHSIKSS